MIDSWANTVTFYTSFSANIEVTGTGVIISAPTVIPSFTDTGITITTIIVNSSTGLVTISGQYTDIIPINYTWRDNNFILHSGITPPKIGSYIKFVKIGSPSILSSSCYYTINSVFSESTGTDIFTSDIVVNSFDTVKNVLNGLLAGTKA